MLPQTAVHWLSSAGVGAKFGAEQLPKKTEIQISICSARLNKSQQEHTKVMYFLEFSLQTSKECVPQISKRHFNNN